MRPFPRSTQSDNRLLAGSLVEYQQHGCAHVAIVIAEKRNKFVIRNAQDATLELGSDRLVLLSQNCGVDPQNSVEVIEYLYNLETQVASILPSIELLEVWELLIEENKSIEIARIQELLFADASIPQQIALRRVLFGEQVYFKRKKKSDSFDPRPASLVEELLHQKKIEQEKQAQRDTWIDKALLRLKDFNNELPEPLQPLEQLAAHGKGAPQAKEAQLLVDTLIERANLPHAKSITQRSYDVLVALGHFSPHELLTPYRLQRPLSFSDAEIEAANSLQTAKSTHKPRPDLRAITIDGPDTKDFDDALSFQRDNCDIEQGNILIGVHISDVSSVISPESVLQQTALRRATSVYCPDKYFPMLPRQLSENFLSLKEGKQRAVMSFYFEVNQDYEVVSTQLCLEEITVYKRATYEEVDTCLCDGNPELQEFEDLLRFCWELSSHSEVRRLENGAAQFVRRELNPSIDESFNVTVTASDEDTPARKLVSELMIMTNQAAADYANRHHLPLLFRTQEAPDVEYADQGSHIAEGPAREFFQRSFFKRSAVQTTASSHFGLGVDMYTQITSPIRRAMDLLNQQQLTYHLQFDKELFSTQTLEAHFDEVQKGLDEAFQIQRESNRYWLLQYISQQKIRTVQGIVMKTDGARPLAEIDVTHSLFTFHVAQGASVKPGDRVTLEIQSINPRKDSLVLRQVI